MSVTVKVPVGVGVAGRPTPAGTAMSSTPASMTLRRRSDREICTERVVVVTSTSSARIQPVVPFGRTGSCTSSQSPWRSTTPNTSGWGGWYAVGLVNTHPVAVR